MLTEGRNYVDVIVKTVLNIKDTIAMLKREADSKGVANNFIVLPPYDPRNNSNRLVMKAAHRATLRTIIEQISAHQSGELEDEHRQPKDLVPQTFWPTPCEDNPSHHRGTMGYTENKLFFEATIDTSKALVFMRYKAFEFAFKGKEYALDPSIFEDEMKASWNHCLDYQLRKAEDNVELRMQHTKGKGKGKGKGTNAA
eukprot:TRINITY_DN112265_c0_g1_i1.p1 TRINITY_DN112265_c0_g1~~TRINITY_DN112265_c0_g1_i1.p1  ORF type:complete len:198 (+),score=58.21 TRINITY_DN112265_c0_g1_i1:542-1135(+)